MDILSFNEYVWWFVLLIAALALHFGLKRRRSNNTASKKATGVILALEKIALAKEHHVEVKILVMVMPDRSRNFVGELIETIQLTELLSMKIGDKIAVEYCRNQKLILSK